MSTMSEGSGDGQDFELNIVPIIDCFTVLIAYLLVSASFISLAAFDVGVSVSGEGATSVDTLKDPPFALTIRLQESKGLQLQLIGGPEAINLSMPIPPKSRDKWDFLALKKKLTEIKEKYPKLKDVSVTADGVVVYKEIILMIENIKPTYAKVFLAGGATVQAEAPSANPIQ